ncbi:MAG: hypothetical protein EXS46_03140 [Candidatus Taylorbacteria bacterium]|nr:hypothetical protein [Candidatus Taylorbacteria bacterium]
MPKIQTPSVSELKSLLLARLKMERLQQEKLRRRHRQELGNEVQEEDPEVTAFRGKFEDWTSNILAHRLIRNRRNTPLLSAQDFTKFIPSMIKEIERIEGVKPDAKSCRIFKNSMKPMFSGIVDSIHSMVPPHKDPYKEYWRWVMTVLKLSSERNTPPTDLLTLEEAADEIVRRMFTKRQFVALSKKEVNRYMNADVINKSIVQPMLGMNNEGTDEERLALKYKYEMELMPQLREKVKKFKIFMDKWLKEEVKRIYAKK